jgi:hypothetical protein
VSETIRGSLPNRDIAVESCVNAQAGQTVRVVAAVARPGELEARGCGVVTVDLRAAGTWALPPCVRFCRSLFRLSPWHLLAVRVSLQSQAAASGGETRRGSADPSVDRTGGDGARRAQGVDDREPSPPALLPLRGRGVASTSVASEITLSPPGGRGQGEGTRADVGYCQRRAALVLRSLRRKPPPEWRARA